MRSLDGVESFLASGAWRLSRVTPGAPGHVRGAGQRTRLIGRAITKRPRLIGRAITIGPPV